MGSSEKPSCEKVSMGTLLWRNGEPKEKHVSNSKIIDEMETAVAALCEQLDHSADEKEMDCAGWKAGSLSAKQTIERRIKT